MQSGGVRVGLVQPGGARPERPVDEQITGQPSSPGLGHQVTGLGRRGHGLTPVPDHLDSVLECTQPQPVVEPADFRTGAFVHATTPAAAMACSATARASASWTSVKR